MNYWPIQYIVSQDVIVLLMYAMFSYCGCLNTDEILLRTVVMLALHIFLSGHIVQRLTVIVIVIVPRSFKVQFGRLGEGFDSRLVIVVDLLVVVTSWIA